MLALYYSSGSAHGTAVQTAAQLVAAQLVGFAAYAAAQLTSFDWRLLTAATALIGTAALGVWRVRGVHAKTGEWSGARALAALPLCAVLACASLLNFSFALVAAVLLVPVYGGTLALAPQRALPPVAVLLSAVLGAALLREELHAHVWPQLLQQFGSLWMPLVVLVIVPLNICIFLLGL